MILTINTNPLLDDSPICRATSPRLKVCVGTSSSPGSHIPSDQRPCNRNHGKTMGKPWENHRKMDDLPEMVMTTVTVCY